MRVALFVCEQRATQDLADPSNAAIFTNLPVQDGAINDINDPAVARAIDVLYKRALQRAPTPEEIGHIQGLYQELADTGEADPAKAWATLSCFSVLTTMESLFY